MNKMNNNVTIDNPQEIKNKTKLVEKDKQKNN
jgi:hypothetical protein